MELRSQRVPSPRHPCFLLGVLLLLLGSSAGLDGQTDEAAEAFWAAAREGDVAAVERWLAEGVDVDTPFRYGATALSYACDRGHVEVVRVLLAHGATVNVRDTYYGFTPFDRALQPPSGRRPEHLEIVRLLLDHGAEGTEAVVTRVLQFAIEAGNLPVVEATVPALTTAILTDALDRAVAGGQAAVVARLRAAGARTTAERFEPPAAEMMARYVGSYRRDAGGVIAVAVEAGRLVAGLGFVRAELKPGGGGPDRFRVAWTTDATVEFGGAGAGGEGRVRRVEIRGADPGLNVNGVYVRVEAQPQ